MPLPFDEVHVEASLRKRTENEIEIDFEWLAANKPHRIRPKGEPWAGAGAAARAGASQPPPASFANPYYFLPMKDRAEFKGELADCPPVGHDRYLAGKYSGTLRVKLTTKTPLLICDDGAKTEVGGHLEYGVRMRGGKPLLASSSVRGMLRGEYEGVTNSRFGVFPGAPPRGSEPAEYHGRRLGFRLPANQSLSTVPVRIVRQPDGTLVAQVLPGTARVRPDGAPMQGDPLYAAWCQHYGQGRWRCGRSIRVCPSVGSVGVPHAVALPEGSPARQRD